MSGAPRPSLAPVALEPLLGAREVRVQPDGLFKVPDRLHGAALGLQNDREVMVSLGELRRQQQGGPKSRLGLLVVTAQVKLHRSPKRPQ